MDLLGLLVIAIPAVLIIWLLSRGSESFRDPNSMNDKEILSAIAGQADWLEKQLIHVAKFGGKEPQPDIAAKRREYIYRLCKILVERHPKPINIMYDATKRAAQLESEGVPHKIAVVQGVKQRLFAENGVNYMARWHSSVEAPGRPAGDA